MFQIGNGAADTIDHVERVKSQGRCVPEMLDVRNATRVSFQDQPDNEVVRTGMPVWAGYILQVMFGIAVAAGSESVRKVVAPT